MRINPVIFCLIFLFLMRFSVFIRKKNQKKKKGVLREKVLVFILFPFPQYSLLFFQFFFLTKTENCIKNEKIKQKITEFIRVILLKTKNCRLRKRPMKSKEYQVGAVFNQRMLLCVCALVLLIVSQNTPQLMLRIVFL